MINRKSAILLIIILVTACGLLQSVDTNDIKRILADSTQADTLTKPDGIKYPAISIFKYFTGLIIVFGLIWIFVYLMKKLTFQRKNTTVLDKNAEVLDVFPIGNKQALYIVHLFNEIMILGVTSETINLLKTITDPDEIEKIKTTKNENKKQFSNLLNRFKKSE